ISQIQQRNHLAKFIYPQSRIRQTAYQAKHLLRMFSRVVRIFTLPDLTAFKKTAPFRVFVVCPLENCTRPPRARVCNGTCLPRCAHYLEFVPAEFARWQWLLSLVGAD